MSRTGLVVVVLLLGLSDAGALEEESPVGVWEIIELVNWSASGEKVEPYGSKPTGYFVYTPGGRLILHVTRNPPLEPQSSPVTTEDLAARAGASIAYFGTYSVDREKGIIYHEIAGDLVPNRVGSSQARPYRIEGDELTIDIPGDNGAHYFRRLRRVESLPGR